MKDALIDLPAMYGDHHVTRVRAALLGLDGVSDVQASAARRKVLVHYDEGNTSLETIEGALTSAGYPPGQMPVPSSYPKRHEDGSAWYVVIDRKTTTEMKDREMAGDFRRY